MLSSLAHLLAAIILTIVLFGGGMLTLGCIMHASAEDQAEAIAAAKADRQADAFIWLIAHCEANPAAC